MIVIGVICLLLGFVAAIPILWTVGIILIIVGAILAIAGGVGHSVGSRRHYW